jgi:flagellar biosynthesis protein FliR
VITLILALRGAAAIAILLVLVGGIPRIVQIGLAAILGLWCSLLVGATPAAAPTGELLWLLAGRELVIGVTIGMVAALPLLAAAMAGRLVDVASGWRTHGPYSALFGVLAAAVFVGIDGHVALIAGIVESFQRIAPMTGVAGAAEAGMAGLAGADAAASSVLATLGVLVPIGVKLAIPWLVTAAVVEIAAGAATRLAGRAALHAPIRGATEAALVMMTASLVSTLAVAIAVLIR